MEWSDGRLEEFELGRVDGQESDAALLAGGEGHLAAAQEAALAADNGWQVVWSSTPRGAFRYRFSATGGSTQWFQAAGAEWLYGDHGTVQGLADRQVGDAEWLVSPLGVHRARFAFGLASADHVVGFGERFDAVDQTGRCLDAVVFEQYKAQGRHGRTYLPMPFAHVVNEDGSSWGFHVRTSRRTWYDVGAADRGLLQVEVDLGLAGEEPGARPVVDVGVWSGSPTEVLTGFLDHVGRATELPDWVFRLWASGNEWNTEALVMAQMDRHRVEGVPGA